MKAKILTFSPVGDTTLLAYDTETVDVEEVNRVIAEYEAKTGAQPFDMATGERIEGLTREQQEVLMASRVRAKPAMRGHFKTGHSRPGTLDVVPAAALSCKSHF